MAEQINPTGSLVSGLAMMLPAAASLPQPGPQSKPIQQTSKRSPTESAAQNAASGVAEVPDRTLAQLNAQIQKAATDLKIQVDKATGRTVYKVVDESSGKVVLQVPSDEVLAMARNLRAMDSNQNPPGVLVDKQG